MMSQRPTSHLGAVRSGGDTIPIRGMDEVDFARSTNWEFSTTAAAPWVATWNGDSPLEVPLRWVLVAGSNRSDLATAEDLVKYMRWWHSWSAGDYQPKGDATITTPPPKVDVVIGGFFTASGILKNTSATPKKPWIGSGLELPMAITFSGTFVPLPGYNGNTTDIAVLSKAYGRSSIKTRFYKE